MLCAAGQVLAESDQLGRCLDTRLTDNQRVAACTDYAENQHNPAEDRSDALAARGWVNLNAGQFDAARGDFYAAGRFDGNKAKVNANLGLGALAWEFDSFALARQSASDVLAIESRHAEALYLRGAAAGALQDFSAGLADADALVADYPKDPLGPELKGFLYQRRAAETGVAADSALALREYGRAMSLSNSPAPRLLRRFAWLLATAPKDLRDGRKALDYAQQALDAAVSVIKVPKQLAVYHHTLAIALAANGRTAEAEREFEAVMEHFPGARSRFQKALAQAGYLNKAGSATLYELIGSILACLEDACGALAAPLVYKTL